MRPGRNPLREQGLRPVTPGAPDVRAPGFAAEARRQSPPVSRSPHDEEGRTFIDAVSLDWADED
ncbi:antitoxin MazE family protein [Skermanella mucosa]|uniref:antitoxin MazE-like protein n=1 Tax=Skermanella mucosa TaxID=1789672 RepID=UPI00192B603D|nr:antitoxin MazE-like protein [Skermanella mucosa]UEM24059.1 antitoxin MazE family protein [Skermanella mucosa]